MLDVETGSELPGVGAPQVRPLLMRFRGVSLEVVVHGYTGLAPANRKASEVEQRIVAPVAPAGKHHDVCSRSRVSSRSRPTRREPWGASLLPQYEMTGTEAAPVTRCYWIRLTEFTPGRTGGPPVVEPQASSQPVQLTRTSITLPFQHLCEEPPGSRLVGVGVGTPALGSSSSS